MLKKTIFSSKKVYQANISFPSCSLFNLLCIIQKEQGINWQDYVIFLLNSWLLGIDTIYDVGGRVVMKRVLFLALLVLTIFLIPFTAQADETPRVFVDGQELTFDVAPANIDGRIMVPLRSIFEALNCPVIWNAYQPDIATARIGQQTLVLGIGWDSVYVDNMEHPLLEGIARE
ncbi:MAG TPA: copper amine oxidase N-terminal domain-containing protein [Syntrophomonadaceae bacterium]|nr:copper amine oxidase N-terminal domain-containing protein [Syntrophomonadaceae bacterium]